MSNPILQKKNMQIKLQCIQKMSKFTSKINVNSSLEARYTKRDTERQ